MSGTRQRTDVDVPAPANHGTGDENDREYSAPAAACAADLMQALKVRGVPMTHSDLTSAVGHTRSLVYRVLHELERSAVVAKDDRGYFWFTIDIVEMAGAVLNRLDLNGEVRAVLRKLANETGETANLGILRGRDVLYLDREIGRNAYVTIAYVGHRIPAHCTAMGKVLLAEMTDEELTDLYSESTSLARLTPQSLGSPAELFTDIERTRKLGYGSEREETISGRGCIAVRVPLSRHEPPIGAVSISTSLTMLDSEWSSLLESLESARDALVRLHTAIEGAGG